ncbi:MAG: hypothetical protein J5U17_11175, partial [Candidatus Methanoperedens sp.]|nr:hypothetical protein [Candidatus Methanoperedens sp.]
FNVMFLHGIFILTDLPDKTSNISILSCKLHAPALLPTHVAVGLPQMEGVAYSAICDATFLSRSVIRVPFGLMNTISSNQTTMLKTQPLLYPAVAPAPAFMKSFLNEFN